MEWEGSFLAYSRIGSVLLRTVDNELNLELTPRVFIPTLTNKIMDVLQEAGLNFHSPVHPHMRACQDCNWHDHDKYKEDANV